MLILSDFADFESRTRHLYKLLIRTSYKSRPRGYFQIRRSGGGGGGLDLTSSLQANFGARSGQVHQIRGKTCEVLSPQDTKSFEKVPILESYLKFRGQNLGYIFGEKIWSSNKNFRGKFWGQAPPDLLIWKYPLGPLGKT